ncbi:MAG: saccharopine dehydrogenase NADP-binding domain-containing protein [Saprospiraceae bacterium]|nr:saccharopine dehydrogenase NADP-binding domain-containing protein [Saprospiraceae bacterium]
MKNILIIGAGRSATALIKYVLDNAEKVGWFVTVADADPALANEKVGNHPYGRAIWLDATKPNDRKAIIERADVVVSLLPASLHYEVAQECILLKKHLVTASYVSQELYRLSEQVRNSDLVFMGEMGLDPGIDHMSAMRVIDEIKDRGGVLTSFSSFAGGLVSPDCDTNPWHYKISWNPRNVVLAGRGTAQYLEDGKHKYVPYHRLFKEHRIIDIPGVGPMEVYPNRDSLLYKEVYGLDGIPNLIRGTLRYPGFCDAWHALVQIGLTDDSFPITDCAELTYLELMEAFVGDAPGKNVREKVANLLEEELESQVMQQLEWLGLFQRKKIGLKPSSPATILEHLIVDKWKLGKQDRDWIVMYHEFEYKLGGKKYLKKSVMTLEGDNPVYTAMAKLVGLPLGIFVKYLVTGGIRESGVQIPVKKSIYEPVMKELESFGVVFRETETLIK